MEEFMVALRDFGFPLTKIVHLFWSWCHLLLGPPLSNPFPQTFVWPAGQTLCNTRALAANAGDRI